jgi:hypothetical protein
MVFRHLDHPHIQSNNRLPPPSPTDNFKQKNSIVYLASLLLLARDIPMFFSPLSNRAPCGRPLPGHSSRSPLRERAQSLVAPV